VININCIKKLIAIGLFASLTACGGGGGGGSTAVSEPGNPAVVASATLTGVFVDAPTKGLAYKALPSGLSGVTDVDGKFKYRDGDKVSFSIATTGGDINLGTIMMSVPSNGDAVVSVLSLPNGQASAQILQTLNKGNSANIDVSNLSLSAADVTALNAYIDSPTKTAPSVTIAGVIKPLVDGNTAVSAAITSLGNPSINSLTAANISSALSGKATLSVGAANNGTTGVFGLAYFAPNGTVSEVWNDGTLDSYTWASSNGQLNVTRKGVTASASFLYLDGNLGVSKYKTFDGMDVSSIGFFIKPTTYADWANRTLTVTGNTSSYCNPLPMYMTISSDGSKFLSTCKLGTPAYASGTITQFAAMPGVLLLQEVINGSSSFFYAGLLAGGSLTSGQLFTYVPSTGNSPFRSNLLSIKSN
jgi:hypothetical protein